MMKLILSLLLQLFIISCGVQVETEDPYTTESVGTPNKYQHLDMSCDEMSEEAKLMEPQIELFINGEYKKVHMDGIANTSIVSNLLLGGSIENSLVKRGLIETETAKKMNFNCIDFSKLTGETYEDATLSLLDPLNKFESHFPEIIKENNFPRVQIRVLPEYTRVRKERSSKTIKREQLVNNALYSANRKEIIFLPQGSTDLGFIPFGGVPLWKVPMVSLHEYGHHIFRSIVDFKGKKSQLGKDSISKLCIDNREPLNFGESHLHRESAVSQVVRKTGSAEAISVLNEGFADLFAFYANTESTYLYKLGCMSNSRDVLSPKFLANEDKILTQDVLDVFFSPVKQEARACSVYTDFQDVHSVGAIYAYSFNKLLSYTSLDLQQKIQFILKWVRLLDSKLKEKMTSEKILELAILNFYKLYMKDFPDKSIHCDSFFMHFPTVKYTCK